MVSDGQIVKNQKLSNWKYHNRKEMKHLHTQSIIIYWTLKSSPAKDEDRQLPQKEEEQWTLFLLPMNIVLVTSQDLDFVNSWDSLLCINLVICRHFIIHSTHIGRYYIKDVKQPSLYPCKKSSSYGIYHLRWQKISQSSYYGSLNMCYKILHLTHMFQRYTNNMYNIQIY